MRFFKVFFAALLALIVFTAIGMITLMVLIGKAITPEKVSLSPNSVLVLETSQKFMEQEQSNPLGNYFGDLDTDVPGLYEAIRLIDHAADDDNIKGIYLKVNGNGNEMATNAELRRALQQFKKSGKFVYAYGEVIDQGSYFLATAADKVYLNPHGGVDFRGFATEIMFLKGALDKLEIKPEIFYCGKFKSATEPLRENKMTDANREQTTLFLGQLYGNFLSSIGASRKIDTATLHQYANDGLIQEPGDALKYKLVDGLKYDDEVTAELKSKLNIKSDEKINFVSLSKYDNASTLDNGDGDSKIAVIYAQGNIVSGDSEKENTIASDIYVRDIRKVREDKNIKAVVFRVNSGGGSALASEVIWRELSLTKKVKPVIVSMGDYAASGGYYISCMADTIFAEPNTLTGSIGVFGVMMNLSDFFKNKLGVTFDGVKTATYADLGTSGRAMTEAEKKLIQNSVDSTYATFKSRVVAGRKLDPAIVDSIAQGHVWSGTQALKLGLVDRLGGIDAALASAAKMAKLSSYKITEYPDVKPSVGRMLRNMGNKVSTSMVKKEMGEAEYHTYQELKSVKELHGQVLTRMPFDYIIR
ncbi:signal peptide peptidase SppA [Chitinophaga sp. sic0106]|uniref:signal peptide peptidase SppA n=1 Tax=Chitinophaga sp. sic0106 TaxID=2854785 RepID=UPI001C438B41|nr:signal peptide peptidase SppA [Chitinophaga sp. sic0106]MBV7533174.1 signal peptide peptidase SppA [Chitinophaga sp. sic0106]